MIHARKDYNRIQDPENKIPKDEPVFLLRGQDKFAPQLLRQWAELVLDEGNKEMAAMVFNHADKMDVWQTENVCKVPDLPVNYNDTVDNSHEVLSSMKGYTFGGALELMKQGKGVRLPQWQNDVVIRAQFPDANSKMTAPYLYVSSRFGKVPWKETMIELFSNDWEIVD